MYNFTISFIPECVARVPVSLWGSGGWGCVRSTLPNRSQLSATVRNRPRDPRMAVPMVRSAKGVTFGSFTCGAAHSDVFGNVPKVVLCCRRNTFATFSGDVLQFSWQAQHFGRVHRHFAWQVQHFRRFVLRVFCESHCQGCVKWRQGASSVAGMAFCEMWLMKLTEAWHETSILR